MSFTAFVLYGIDAGLTQFINSFSGYDWYADSLASWISLAGIPVMVFVVAVQWWTLQNRSHTRHVLLTAGFSFMLSLALNQLILVFINRVRPYNEAVTNLLIAPSGDPSFPSDHATAAFAIATVFMAYHFKGAKTLLISAILISVSRIYVGTHFVSDIVGGAITGMLAAGLVVWIYREGSLADRFLTSIL